jgi:diacylglycerol O-acyltransferase / wax synthase
MDRGPVPQQFAAILVLDPDPAFDVARAEQVLAQRIRAVPRLRQRLSGGPRRRVWVDDPRFDPARQIQRISCPPPGDERALLDLATSLVTTPIPRTGPLWQAAFITGLADGATAVIVVLRHVLADGIGGLAVLASLTDAASAENVIRPVQGRLEARVRSLRWSMFRGASDRQR